MMNEFDARVYDEMERLLDDARKMGFSNDISLAEKGRDTIFWLIRNGRNNEYRNEMDYQLERLRSIVYAIPIGCRDYNKVSYLRPCKACGFPTEMAVYSDESGAGIFCPGCQKRYPTSYRRSNTPLCQSQFEERFAKDDTLLLRMIREYNEEYE